MSDMGTVRIPSQRELQGKMSPQEMQTIYGEKQKKPLWKRNIKAIANAPHNLQFGATTGRHSIHGKKRRSHL